MKDLNLMRDCWITVSVVSPLKRSSETFCKNNFLFYFK